MKRKYRHILVYLPAYVKSNRDLLRGILAYGEKSGSWEIEIIGIAERYERNAERDFSEFAGAICYDDGSAVAQKISSLPIPVLLVLPDPAPAPFHRKAPRGVVVCESRRLGRAAANYFMEKKLASYVFVGRSPLTQWSIERRDAFLGALSRSHTQAVAFEMQEDAREPLGDFAHACSQMPRPIGIFAENDRMARSVLSACRNAGLSVPQDVRLLGVDDDELLCRTANPPLSSLRMDSSHIGERAAKTLNTMIKTGQDAPHALSYGYSALVERSSTADEVNYGSIPDRARAYISTWLEKGGRPLLVSEIVRALGVSRRSLELEFRRKTGHTIHDEILRQQLRKAMHFLTEGTETIETIADQCGFSSSSHFGLVFRKQYGRTPTEARAKPE